MKFQRGDAGVGMLVVMVVMMIGIWVASGHSGSGHHAKESVTVEPASAALVSSRSNATANLPQGQQ